MTGFEVVGGDLRTHADKVNGHALTLGQAVKAADYAMSDGTYGIICQFLPPLFNEIEQAGREAVMASRDSLTRIAENLVSTADSYEAVDQTAGWTFRVLEDNA
jgi:excreted virulence factor EspC (type VII ESX diderm)